MKRHLSCLSLVSLAPVLLVLSACQHRSPSLQPPLSEADMQFLEDMTRAVLAESLVAPGAFVGTIGPNSSGAALIRPGGRDDYPAFWVRDYAMSLDSGLVTPDVQRHHLFLTAAHQVDAEIALPTGSRLPAGSVPDHISFGGVPIFFPGILEDYANQGGPQWGLLPSLDDHFYFIHMAACYVNASGGTGFLQESVNGKTLLQRLEAAYNMPPSLENGIVSVTNEDRGVNFGFFDTTVHTGALFFCSLLKYQAALELEELVRAAGNKDRARYYAGQAESIRSALPGLFQEPGGFLRASTGLSAQTDVWGTAFAVYIHALPVMTEQRACLALADALRRRTIQWEGAIRHVPTDQDFSETTAWEKSYVPKDTYQNGAYWDTPVGWVCYAVAQVDADLAKTLAAEYMAQLRSGDYRQGPDFGAPWECRHGNGHRQNPVYLASVSVPLAAFRRINQ